MGNKIPAKRRTSIEECAEALRKSGGFLTGAAKLLGISPGSLCQRISNHPELKAIQDEIKESYLDMAETALLKKVKALDLGAICFYLKCQGKKRGYIEKDTQQQSSEANVQVVIVKDSGEVLPKAIEAE